MKSRFAVALLCVATSACSETLPPVVSTGYPPPAQPNAAPVPSVSTLNQMMTRLEQMQREIQQLTGKVEDQVFLIAELKKQQKTMYSDFNERLTALENKGAAAPATTEIPADTAVPATDVEAKPVDTTSSDATAVDATAGAVAGTEAATATTSDTATPASGDAAPADTAPEPTSAPTATTAAELKKAPKLEAPIQASEGEKQEYEAAYNQLRKGHTTESIAAFDAYLVKYPTSGYASNVQYWLGEAYRVNQDNDAAKAAFNKVIDSYPTSSKVPDALLKLGYIEVELNNTAKATEYLTRITTEFPNSNAAYLASKKLAGLGDAKP